MITFSDFKKGLLSAILFYSHIQFFLINSLLTVLLLNSVMPWFCLIC